MLAELIGAGHLVKWMPIDAWKVATAPMALLLDSLYDALKAAGAPEEQARAAARDVAGYDNCLNRVEPDLSILKCMVGVVIAMQLGTFWMQWQVVDRLAGIEARLTALESDSQASIATPQASSIDQ